ncbi:MAG: NmrA family NAD(P)-binding protein [Mucilaginibacter sp.]
MNIISGGTGQIGSALANALLKNGEAVTIISRSSKSAADWQAKGAKFAVADIYDTESLQRIFKTGKNIFVLNPPADPLTDTDMQERKTGASLVAALKGTHPEKIIVASTLGARPGSRIGDLNTLYDLEQGIASLGLPHQIIRSAYYMSNWASSLPGIKETGELVSFFPKGLKIPMVAPQDIGELAANSMMSKDGEELTAIVGPKLYSPQDVADEFSSALGKKVSVKVIPKKEWTAAYKSAGFSGEAAASYAAMTEIAANDIEIPKHAVKGKTTLQQFINNLIKVV